MNTDQEGTDVDVFFFCHIGYDSDGCKSSTKLSMTFEYTLKY